LRGLHWKKLLLALGVVFSVWLVQGITAESNVANAADADFNYNVVSGNAVITGYAGTDTVIVIPHTLGGHPVTSIEAEAFKSKGLTSVTLNEGLEKIEIRAFEDNALTEIEIPASVTVVDHYAFYANDLTTVTLHEGLERIGINAFSSNELTEIEIPASVASIGSRSFYMNELTKVTLNEGLVSIGDSAFMFNDLVEIEIPASVVSIGNFVFYDNDLTTVTLHEGLERIGGAAFYWNEIAFVAIPSSVTTIGEDAFGFNPPELMIIGRIDTEAHNYAIINSVLFSDITTLLEIQFAPDGRNWAQEARTTVTGDTYGAFKLQYAWSNNEAAPAPGAGWIPFASGDEIEQLAEGEWFLHVHGSLLDREEAWHSERFRVDKTPPTLDVTMTTGSSATPYVHDTWSTGPVTVNATASDLFGEVREIAVEMEYDSQPSVAAYPGNAYSVPLTGNGIYQLKITAIDQAGNVSATEQRIVKINSSPPTTSTPYEKSGNAKLKELLVSAGTLTPAFSGDVTQYTLTIDPKVQKFTVTLLPEHAQASTSLGGQALGFGRVNADISLEPDVNEFEIVVTAEDGTKRTYQVDLERDDADNEHPPVEEACAKTASFTDIAGHWGEAYIIEASCQAIVQGFPDGSFQPDRVITRAEFTVMLARLFAWKGDAAALTFSDMIGKNHWASEAIAQAAAAGVVSGYPDGSFRPEGIITRAEMAEMIANALGLPTDAYLSTAFADDADILAWAKNAAESIRQLGIVIGRGGNNFVPNGAATRTEAAVMLLRASKLK